MANSKHYDYGELMALQEVTREYEILIRYNVDGSIGAHIQRINEILRDSEIVSATVLPPEELTVAQLKDLVRDLAQ